MFKKILISIMTLIVFFTSCYLIPTNVSANGLIVHGSSALKGAVIGSLERGGVKFANKEAKDKAYDAWNLKAYEKWQSDEALGKNADLWENFNKIKASSPVANPINELPGFGKVLLDSTFFGMAVAIGGEIGLEIQQNQLEKTRMDYLTNEPKPYEGTDFAQSFGVSYTKDREDSSSGWSYKVYTFSDGSTASEVNSPYPQDTGTYWIIESFKKQGDEFEIFYNRTHRTWQGELFTNKGSFYLPSSRFQGDIRYSLIPNAMDVPNINIPEVLNPLVGMPDLGLVPSRMPSNEPVEVIVPLSDPFADNPHNTPYHGKESAPGEETPPPGGGDTEPPKDPELPPKEPVGTNPFKNLIPIAMLLALLDLLVAILLYLVRMFEFILKLPLVTPKPIPYEAFIWFKNVTWLGIKPYSLTMTLATFFVGFMAFKSIRRLFP